MTDSKHFLLETNARDFAKQLEAKGCIGVRCWKSAIGSYWLVFWQVS